MKQSPAVLVNCGVEYGTCIIVIVAWLGPLVAMMLLKRAPRALSLPTTNSNKVSPKNEADSAAARYYDSDKDIKVSYNLLGVLSSPAGWLLIWTLAMLAGILALP